MIDTAALVDGLGTLLKWVDIVIVWPLLVVTAILLWLLRRKRRDEEKPENKLLRYCAWFALTAAIVITVFCLIFLNNDLPVPYLDLFATRVWTRGVFLLFIPVAVFFLLLWWRAE